MSEKELPKEKPEKENTIEEISLIKNTLEASRELRIFLDNPIVSSKIKSEVLKELFDTRVGNDLASFLQFLVKKWRENLLLEV